MPNLPDSDHLHVCDAVGFKVPEKVLAQLGISGQAPFTGRRVRCSAGDEGHDYVMVANDDCYGRNPSVEEFEEATARAILAHFS